MLFLNDILVLDFETDGINPATLSPLQIGAVLLDKDTLLSKAEFAAYCKPGNSEWSSEAEGVHGLTRDFLLKAGDSAVKVFSLFEKSFDINNVTVASWNMFDVQILRRFLGIEKYRGLYKFIELWSYTYPFLLMNKAVLDKDKRHGLDALVDYFEIKRHEKHDALQDAKIEAEVFQRVTLFYKLSADEDVAI